MLGLLGFFLPWLAGFPLNLSVDPANFGDFVDIGICFFFLTYLVVLIVITPSEPSGVK